MKRQFSNWLIMFLSLVAVTGFCFTPVLADEIDLSTGLSLEQQEEVIAPIEDLQNDFEEESFGTGYQYTWVPAADFQRYYDQGEYLFESYYGYLTSGNLVVATIQLPSGAYLAQARLYYYDVSANDITIGMFRHTVYTGFSTLCVASPTGTPGHTYANCNANTTISNNNNLYHIYVTFIGAGGSSLKFMGVRLLWRRQTSPAPASTTFNDVPTWHWAFRQIEALAKSGITSGCGGGNFCPDMNVTRAQMAVFLSSALGLHWD